jgi:hypothetical protein
MSEAPTKEQFDALQTELATLKSGNAELVKAVESLTTERDGALSRTHGFEQTLAQMVMAPVVERLIHPSVATLLPKPELDATTGRPTDGWQAKLTEWEQEHGSLLKPATAPDHAPAPIPPPPAPAPAPAPAPRVSTPPTDPSRGNRDIHYWRKLRADDPGQFRSRHDEYQADLAAWNQ